MSASKPSQKETAPLENVSFHTTVDAAFKSIESDFGEMPWYQKWKDSFRELFRPTERDNGSIYAFAVNKMVAPEQPGHLVLVASIKKDDSMPRFQFLGFNSLGSTTIGPLSEPIAKPGALGDIPYAMFCAKRNFNFLGTEETTFHNRSADSGEALLDTLYTSPAYLSKRSTPRFPINWDGQVPSTR